MFAARYGLFNEPFNEKIEGRPVFRITCKGVMLDKFGCYCDLSKEPRFDMPLKTHSEKVRFCKNYMKCNIFEEIDRRNKKRMRKYKVDFNHSFGFKEFLNEFRAKNTHLSEPQVMKSAKFIYTLLHEDVKKNFRQKAEMEENKSKIPSKISSKIPSKKSSKKSSKKWKSDSDYETKTDTNTSLSESDYLSTNTSGSLHESLSEKTSRLPFQFYMSESENAFKQITENFLDSQSGTVNAVPYDKNAAMSGGNLKPILESSSATDFASVSKFAIGSSRSSDYAQSSSSSFSRSNSLPSSKSPIQTMSRIRPPKFRSKSSHKKPRIEPLLKSRPSAQAPVFKPAKLFCSTGPTKEKSHSSESFKRSLAFNNYFKIFLCHYPNLEKNSAIELAQRKYQMLDDVEKYHSYGLNPEITLCPRTCALHGFNSKVVSESVPPKKLPKLPKSPKASKASKAPIKQKGQNFKKSLAFTNYFKIFLCHYPELEKATALKLAKQRFQRLDDVKKYRNYGLNPKITLRGR